MIAWWQESWLPRLYVTIPRFTTQTPQCRSDILACRFCPLSLNHWTVRSVWSFWPLQSHAKPNVRGNWEDGRSGARWVATAGRPWRNPPTEEQIERCLSSQRTTHIASNVKAAADSSAEFNYPPTCVERTQLHAVDSQLAPEVRYFSAAIRFAAFYKVI